MATQEEMQRALAMYSGYDPLAEQQAALEQQAANDALMGGTGQQPQTMSEPLMSEAPAMAPAVASTAFGEPVDPNSVSSVPPEALMSQQLASYPEPAQPAPQPAQVGAAPVAAPRPASVGGGGGGVRRPSLLSEQTAGLGLAADRANESQAAVDASVGQQSALLEQQGSDRSVNALEQADLLQQKQDALTRAGETAQLQRAERQRVVDQRAKEYEQINTQNAQVEIRDRRSTTQKVMGALAIALGGLADQANLAAGLNIGLNVQTQNAARAMDIVNAAVDRDLAIQRANLENDKDNAAAKFSELGVARAAVQDVDSQEALAKAALLDKYAAGLESLQKEGLADDAVTTGKLAAEQVRGQALQLRQQDDRRLAEKSDDRVFSLQAQKEAQDRAAAAARARANQPMSLKERAEIEGKLLDNEKKRRDLDAEEGGAVDLPGYKAVQTLERGDLATARQIHRSAESLKADYARLDAIRKRNGGGTIFNLNDKVEAEAIINGMGPKYSQLYGSGAPSAAEFENFTKTLINPTEYQLTGLLDPIESYKRGVNQIDAITSAQLGSYGFQKEQTETEQLASKYGARER